MRAHARSREPSLIWLANACVSQLYAAVQAALATIWICVALGTLLGISQRFTKKLTNPIRSFAVVSAALVAFIALLPHALESEGLRGLAAAVGAFVAIPAFDRVARSLFRELPTRTVRLEVGYLGLLVHRLGDGVAMRVEGHGADVLFALGAHEIPIVALVTLAYSSQGIGTALLRAAVLGLASTVGCTAVDVLPNGLSGLHGYADAVAGGILVHIVAHELGEASTIPEDRRLDVLGAALASFILWGSPSSETEPHTDLSRMILHGLLVCAPPLCAGLLVSAALRAARVAWHGATPKGPTYGAQSSSGALQLSESEPANVALSLGVLGWRIAALRWVGARVPFLIAGRSRQHDAEVPNLITRTSGDAALVDATISWRSWWGIEPMFPMIGVWLLSGVTAAAYVNAFVPSQIFASFHPGFYLGAMVSLLLATRLSPIAATPLAAALVSKGFDPSGAVASLWIGAVLRQQVRAALEQRLGSRARAVIAVLIAASVVFAVARLVPGGPHPDLTGWFAAPVVGWSGLGVFAGLCSAGMLRHGVRRWLSLGIWARRPEALASPPTPQHGVPHESELELAQRSRAGDAN